MRFAFFGIAGMNPGHLKCNPMAIAIVAKLIIPPKQQNAAEALREVFPSNMNPMSKHKSSASGSIKKPF